MSLEVRLKARIAATGPITVAEYMAAALLDPDDGYYTTKVPFGKQGDFVTAPDISQMFGEIVGLCLAQTWLDQGGSKPFTLLELGPGRGTLMADMLRATWQVPGFHDDLHLALLEASPRLQAEQSSSLAGYNPTFVTDLTTLPAQPLFVVANEFFDALGVRQFQRDGQGWRERHIGLVDDALTLGLGPSHPQPALAHRLEDTTDGDLVEDRPQQAPTIEQISHHISQHGGAALIIDYGDWRSLGDTLQAIEGHERVDPFHSPGQADLTAHVDFEALAAAATGVKYTRLTPQGVFLERLGITARAQHLLKSLGRDEHEAHIAAHRRLTHPDEMGTLFKVIGLYPETAAPPPGLEP